MIHVVLCDDHAVLRRGIRDTLLDDPDIEVTAEAGGYSELREALRHAPCDVLLLDINMPGRNGLEVLASLRETHPGIRVLIVSMYPEDQYALRCLKAALNADCDGQAGLQELAGNGAYLRTMMSSTASSRASASDISTGDASPMRGA